jgi:hypothetical protein
LLLQRDAVRAAGVIRAGLAGLWAVGDRAFLVFGCANPAVAVLGDGQPHQAACLLGAMAALRDALGALLAPANRPEHAGLLRALRQPLGEAELARALHAERTLPRATAVALVLAPPAQAVALARRA